MVDRSNVRTGGQVSGPWQQTAPLVVADPEYTNIELLAFDVAASDTTDGTEPGLQSAAVELPDIGASEQLGVNLVSAAATDWEYSAARNTARITIPRSAPLRSGDLIILDCSTQEALDPGAPQTPSGFTSRGSHYGQTRDNPWTPRFTRFWQLATGDDSGRTITVNWSPPSGRFARPSLFVHVWRGVDQSSPFANGSPSTNAEFTPNQPSPGPLPDVLSGATVIRVLMANNSSPGGGVEGNPDYSPLTDQWPGYTGRFDNAGVGSSRYWILSSRLTDGGEEPGGEQRIFDDETDFNWRVATEALRPAAIEDARRIGVVVAAFSVDNAASAAIFDAPSIGGADERYTLTVGANSGEFQLHFGATGDTGDLAFDISSSALQTRLRALSNIGGSNVIVTPGPGTRSHEIRFTGSLGQQRLTSELTNRGADATLIKVVTGQAPATLTVREQTNHLVPNRPKIVFASGRVANYVAGSPVSVRTSSRNGNNGWAIIVLVFAGVTDRVLNAGNHNDASGNTTSVDLGNVNVARNGGRLFVALGKGVPTAVIPAPPQSTIPLGAAELAGVDGPFMTADAYLTPPSPVGGINIGRANWSGTQQAQMFGFEIEPFTAAGTGAFATVIADGSDQTFVDIARAVGQFYEVIEIDIDALPVDAILLGVSVMVRHQSDARSPLRVTLAGIRADGTIVTAVESRAGGYVNTSGGIETIDTGFFTTFGDGSTIRDYDRLGVVLFSTGGQDRSLTTHKVVSVDAQAEFEAGGPIVSSVVLPTGPGVPIRWTYSAQSGAQQTHYRVRLVAGSQPTGAGDSFNRAPDPLNVASGALFYDSGYIAGSLARSHTVDSVPWPSGTVTAIVTARARVGPGLLVESPEARTIGNIPGSPPSNSTQNAGIAFDATTGNVTVNVIATGSRTGQRIWIARSTDGTNWFLHDPVDVTGSPVQAVADAEAPLAVTGLRYRIAFDRGPNSETSTAQNAGGGAGTQLDTSTDQVYLTVPADPALSTVVDVSGFNITRPRRAVRASQPGRTVVSVSRSLGESLSLVFRIKSPTERATLEAVLDSGHVIRFVDIWGRAWYLSPASNLTEDPQIWRPLVSETTNLRDGALLAGTFDVVNPEPRLLEIQT